MAATETVLRLRPWRSITCSPPLTIARPHRPTGKRRAG
ncbi:hypothetical protein [Azospirillum largimobile]